MELPGRIKFSLKRKLSGYKPPAISKFETLAATLHPNCELQLKKMNNQIIKKCIEENELQLSFWNKINHFWVVISALIIPICFIVFKIIDIVNKKERLSKDGDIYIYIIPIILAFLFYLLQKKRLSFKIVETKLSIDEIYKIVDETAKELGWIKNKRTNKYFTANTNPKFTSGSWGEQITIIFTDNKILVNSICDLNKKDSLVSMGRNKKNEQIFISNIKRASY